MGAHFSACTSESPHPTHSLASYLFLAVVRFHPAIQYLAHQIFIRGNRSRFNTTQLFLAPLDYCCLPRVSQGRDDHFGGRQPGENHGP
jgi:hypothetical protein